MFRRVWILLATVVALACPAASWAGLCPKCRDMMFVDSEGKCKSCNGPTSSGALKLCAKCSGELHQCEHCQGSLDGWTGPGSPRPAAGTTSPTPAPRPASDPPVERATAPDVKAKPGASGDDAEIPPAELPSLGARPLESLPDAKASPDGEPAAAPTPIDRTKSGQYTYGKWQYRLDITDAGTRSEGRWGWLSYDGQKLPRGEVNDYYRTPWGPIYWVDVPKNRWGMHGWMPTPVGQNSRQGKVLTPPAGQPTPAAGATAAKQPPAAAKSPAASPATQPAPRGTLQLTKAENGKRARVGLGSIIIVRLAGNPTTGYQWQAVPDANSPLRLMSQPQYTPSPQAAGRPGAGGTYTFTFQALQLGSGAVRLVYARPQDKNQPAAGAFNVSVEVTPAANNVPPAAKPAPGVRSRLGYRGESLRR